MTTLNYLFFKVGSSLNPCEDTYAGSRPFSEPETRAMSDFILSHKDEIKVYLTMHSYSQLWLVPWGYKAEKPADYYDLYVLAEQAVDALEKVRNTDYLLGTAEELAYVSSGKIICFLKNVHTYLFSLETISNRFTVVLK